MIYVGVDPGAQGAVAVLDDLWRFDCFRLSSPPLEVFRWLESQLNGKPVTAYLEHVWGHKGSGMKSVTSFMKNVGRCEMMLEIACGGYTLVTPQKWQKELGCLTTGDKTVSRAFARKMFPQLKISHWNADAMLIAEYAKRITENTLERTKVQ